MENPLWIISDNHVKENKNEKELVPEVDFPSYIFFLDQTLTTFI